MTNPFEYPQNRAELFESPAEEEAHFYFTIMEFEKLIKEHGVDFVMNRMDDMIIDKLYDWLVDGE